ncbi:hypothetical protein R6Q57_003621 [Mikania cordata]
MNLRDPAPSQTVDSTRRFYTKSTPLRRHRSSSAVVVLVIRVLLLVSCLLLVEEEHHQPWLRRRPGVSTSLRIVSGEMGINWFQGTADALRQFTWVFEDAKNKDIEDILILSGGLCEPFAIVFFSRASDCGLLKIDNKNKVVQFDEKLKVNDLLRNVADQGESG